MLQTPFPPHKPYVSQISTGSCKPFHGPELKISVVLFLRITCGYPVGSRWNVYWPEAGSFSPFQDRKFCSFSSLTTRFPVSNNSATGFGTDLDVLAAQTASSLSLTSASWPPSFVIFKTAEDVSASGSSLFATQTTVLTGSFLYHIPM
nr:unnamed protein product [Ipomoea batatas]